MRYGVIVRYHDKIVNFKVTKIQLSGNHILPEFLRLVRTVYHDAISQTAGKTDYPADECLKMENDEIPITKEYLEAFALPYKLPRKFVKLGIDNEQEQRLGLADRLYKLRVKEGRTQADVAYSIPVARTTYAGYETGQNEPDLKTLIKIADIYGVSLDYLAGRYDKNN